MRDETPGERQKWIKRMGWGGGVKEGHVNRMKRTREQIINSLVSVLQFHLHPNKISSKDKLKFNINLTSIKMRKAVQICIFPHFLLFNAY